ncbi:hypothetical protein SELMODRAFT_411772 [Selaginella moellendorffii]|uniref:Uncharacterized protein n=1 Tax=Selaginella moellendorffii TaxID=88036 RepID=D8RJ00_SELML|nr:hypothetical protein SELMODRAFT_411772 [Selaginella moellendorffii]
MATNYATQESQVTLLFSDSSHSSHAVAVKTKDAKFSTTGDLSGADNGDEPKRFQWEAAGIGKIVMKPNESEVEVWLNGYDLRVETSDTVPWDSGNSKKGPEGWGESSTVPMPLILCYASPVSFSEQILAPIGKLEWQPACRESFVATIEVEVFEHAAWGVASEGKLVDSQMFRCAALEFSEDLLEDVLQQQDQSNPNKILFYF